jgi:predicted RNase H-like HicB family nuclease
MTEVHYIALIHKDADSAYGVSFPDLPGVIAAGNTLDDAIAEASAALAFAFEDWQGSRPLPRTLEALRADPDFSADASDAVVAAIRPTFDLLAAE